MKQLTIGVILTVFTLGACTETNKKDNITNDPDTAVLKQDTANTLNANPINDTTIVEKPAK